jgi:hypothetical protein
MKIQQLKFSSENDCLSFSQNTITLQPWLILVFGGREAITNCQPIYNLRKWFPDAIITGCSTSGEITGTTVSENTINITLVEFSHTRLEFREANINDFGNSLDAGKFLARQLPGKNLKHVFVLSEGINVNGTELVKGLRDSLPEGVNVTGGLAGDGAAFQKTLIISNSGQIQSNLITAVGFYGDQLQIGYGSFGGWDSFGIERSVTRSKGNVLYEIDHTPALKLYKSFLGEQAENLPASGLLFPLSMRIDEQSDPIVRTILAVDEKEQSLTFAGDIPEGAFVKLMKANIDRLIIGAEEAAKNSMKALTGTQPQLAVLISCVGRRLVLKQLVEEEVEAVQEMLGNNTTLTGFYSYGEIAPFLQGARCELHNQTMTITTLSETV